MAVPAPAVAAIVDPQHRPAAINAVEYVPHVRLYAARRRASASPRHGVHVFPNDLVATVEHGGGADGAWGRVPDGWEWGLVCAPAASSAPLLDADEGEVTAKLWTEARRLDPQLFPLDTADVVQLIRWRHAVPLVRPGYFGALSGLRQRPPLVFAGDWLVQPCVEGAVRSGLTAASCFSGA